MGGRYIHNVEYWTSKVFIIVVALDTYQFQVIIFACCTSLLHIVCYSLFYPSKPRASGGRRPPEARSERSELGRSAVF